MKGSLMRIELSVYMMLFFYVGDVMVMKNNYMTSSNLISHIYFTKTYSLFTCLYTPTSRILRWTMYNDPSFRVDVFLLLVNCSLTK